MTLGTGDNGEDTVDCARMLRPSCTPTIIPLDAIKTILMVSAILKGFHCSAVSGSALDMKSDRSAV